MAVSLHSHTFQGQTPCAMPQVGTQTCSLAGPCQSHCLVLLHPILPPSYLEPCRTCRSSGVTPVSRGSRAEVAEPGGTMSTEACWVPSWPPPRQGCPILQPFKALSCSFIVMPERRQLSDLEPRVRLSTPVQRLLRVL